MRASFFAVTLFLSGCLGARDLSIENATLPPPAIDTTPLPPQ